MSEETSAGTRPRLAITLGDPRGIGPEIVAKALEDERVREACEPLIVGPEGTGVRVDRSVGAWEESGGAAMAGRLVTVSVVPFQV